MPVRPRPLEERFAAKVDRNGPVPTHRPDLGPCWMWTGKPNDQGYGRITLGPDVRGAARAPRVAFLLAHGRWPEPMALHHCDNPPCVKAIADEHGPSHVFEGDHMANARDMVSKGRHSAVTHPERVARGERHASRTHPELIARGERIWNARLTDAIVVEIDVALSRGDAQRDIAKKYGVRQSDISRIARRESWRHVPREPVDEAVRIAAAGARAGRLARGDQNGSRLHPELLAWGDRNPSRVYPEKQVRGERSAQAKLTLAQVIEIRRAVSERETTQRALARRYGVRETTISAVVRKQNWKDTPYTQTKESEEIPKETR